MGHEFAFGLDQVDPVVSPNGSGKPYDSTSDELDACVSFIQAMGLDPTPDAVGQLHKVFVPCLKIMCERGWDPEGGTWRQAGVLGALADVRKKFFRLWERGWIRGIRHDDSALDLINYVGFYLRSDDNRWNEWGEPGSGKDYE